MMTELSFLIDLLLNHKLSPKTKEHVAMRIKEVEANYSSHTAVSTPQKPQLPPQIAMQSPSTQALMLKHGMSTNILTPPLTSEPDAVPLAPEPVAVIAQTPQAAAAMNSRNTAIAEALSGKVNKETGRPRKF